MDVDRYLSIGRVVRRWLIRVFCSTNFSGGRTDCVGVGIMLKRSVLNVIISTRNNTPRKKDKAFGGKGEGVHVCVFKYEKVSFNELSFGSN